MEFDLQNHQEVGGFGIQDQPGGDSQIVSVLGGVWGDVEELNLPRGFHRAVARH